MVSNYQGGYTLQKSHATILHTQPNNSNHIHAPLIFITLARNAHHYTEACTLTAGHTAGELQTASSSWYRQIVPQNRRKTLVSDELDLPRRMEYKE